MKKFPSNKHWVIELVAVIATLAVILCLKSLLSRSAFITVCFLAFVLSLATALLFRVKKWQKGFDLLSVFIGVAFIAATMLNYSAKEYTFVSGKNPFFALSLIAAIIIGLSVTAAVFRLMRLPPEVEAKEKRRQKKNGKGSVVFILAIVMLLASVFSYMIVESVIEHGNYLFDEGESEAVTAVILEKDRVNRSKGRDYYHFTVEIDGVTVELDVPSSDYNAYREGDTYTFDRYKGAFGEAFYLPDGE